MSASQPPAQPPINWRWVISKVTDVALDYFWAACGYTPPLVRHMWEGELLHGDYDRFAGYAREGFEECIRDFSPAAPGTTAHFTPDERACIDNYIARHSTFRATFEASFKTSLTRYMEQTPKIQSERMTRLQAVFDAPIEEVSLHLDPNHHKPKPPADPATAVDPNAPSPRYRPFGYLLLDPTGQNS